MLTLKRLNETPPCGWTWLDREKQYVVKAGTFTTLLNAVRAYLQANARPIPPNLSDIVQDNIARRAPPNFSTNGGGTHMMLSGDSIVSGTQAMLEIAKARGHSFVSLDLAELRAAECARCPNNVSHPSCLTCNGLKALVNAMVRRKTSRDTQLQVCTVCNCFNSAQVHITAEILARITHSEILDRYPERDQCWKRREVEDERKLRRND